MDLAKSARGGLERGFFDRMDMMNRIFGIMSILFILSKKTKQGSAFMRPDVSVSGFAPNEGGFQPRTSVLPVAAAEKRAVLPPTSCKK